MIYKVIIDDIEIDVSEQDIADLNASSISEGHQVLQDSKSYICTKPEVGQNPKTGKITVNKKKFEFEIKDSYDQLVDSMGLNIAAITKLTDIIAPMPGLILDIMVKEGDTLTEGDSILILEAMKMENVLKAEGDGVVKSINCCIGDTVDKGQVMIEME